MKFLAVKDFAEHQHYRDRRPVWIKLYVRLLDDWTYLQLSEAARGQLVMFWLLASKHDNRVPDDKRYIEGKLQVRRFLRDELVASGFLFETDAETETLASRTGAKPEETAMPEEEREKETYTAETEQSLLPRRVVTIGEAALAERLAGDPDRLSLTAIVSTVRRPSAWVSEIGVALDGMHGVALTPQQVGEAMRDFIGDGHLGFDAKIAHFRGYLNRAGRKRETPARLHRNGKRPTPQSPTYTPTERMEDIACLD